jgi:hypothetical protein
MARADCKLVGWSGEVAPRVTQQSHHRSASGYALHANPTCVSPMGGRYLGGVTGLLSRCYDTATQSESGHLSRQTGATGTHE